MLQVSEDALTAHLEGEAVILNLETKSYFRLNSTAAAIWKGLEEGMSRDDLLSRLTDEYDAEPETAEAGLDRLLADLTERGLLVDADR